MRLISLTLLMLMLLGSCSSRKDYSKKYNLDKTTKLSRVPFVAQEDFQCGPASLAMMMNFKGLTKSADELSREAFTPGKKGSLQSDMISSIRRNKLLPVHVTKFKDLLQEVNAGNPVLVLQNLGLSWFPRWHYAVVTGFDLKKSEIILHSGRLKNTHLGFFTFQKTWERSDNWGLLILKPGELPTNSTELEMVRAMTQLEVMSFYPEAILGYESILTKWPDSLGARIGLGNIYFSQKEYQKSVSQLKAATEKFPQSAEAWHNYALALKENKQMKEAKIAALTAVENCSPEHLPVYQQNLSDLLR